MQRREVKMKHQRNSAKTVGIVGMGLIGGSLGLDLQEMGYQVHGLVNKNQTAEKALARGLAQKVSIDPKVLANCDLIVLALPIQTLLNPDPTLFKALPPKAVVTDVGSVKGPILNVWEKLHPRFVASHPMAGTSESGVSAGLKGLFRNRPWIATPSINTEPEALEEVHNLAKAVGSRWLTSSANLHDKAVALISHLPVLISAALLKTLENEQDKKVFDLATTLASSGFADTTRVGGGNPALGTSMAAHNTDEILNFFSSYYASLKELEQHILQGNWMSLHDELTRTEAIRKIVFK